MRRLRIHHLFDIIRDYGAGKSLSEHAYGHSYHLVANEIFENKISEIKIVVENDDVCVNCKKSNSGKCTDTIQHRTDFKYKEAFNDYLDTQIMKRLGYKKEEVVSVHEIIKNAEKYLNNIFEIYHGNDIQHTEIRKQNVALGINKKIAELNI